ncbi:MAG TPA: damage-inducible protein DinB [Armatimonadetes bacterium]|nr:damage-inducible protein DinB [Armatimonadota bacterium]
MSKGQHLAARWQEIAEGTVRHLERVPLEHWDWRPHPKSTPLGELTIHLVTMAGWGRWVINSEKVDMTNEGPAARDVSSVTNESLVAEFRAGAAASTEALETVSDDVLAEHWQLVGGDQVYIDQPREWVLGSIVLDHIIHHRAQLGVYLRLLDVAVPGIYGPSADETF